VFLAPGIFPFLSSGYLISQQTPIYSRTVYRNGGLALLVVLARTSQHTSVRAVGVDFECMEGTMLLIGCVVKTVRRV
jgi:hypothetical protein